MSLPLKRYRQPNNTAGHHRGKNLAPRFKRQKSLNLKLEEETENISDIKFRKSEAKIKNFATQNIENETSENSTNPWGDFSDKTLNAPLWPVNNSRKTKAVFSPIENKFFDYQSQSPNMKSNEQKQAFPSKVQTPRVSQDISDPDYRTIEMLRELERVAEEREQEMDDSSSGTDRKAMLSHHLRMLICAVDRYVGDEEEFVPQRDDEVSTNSPAQTPPPTTTQNHLEPQHSVYQNIPQSNLNPYWMQSEMSPPQQVSIRQVMQHSGNAQLLRSTTASPVFVNTGNAPQHFQFRSAVSVTPPPPSRENHMSPYVHSMTPPPSFRYNSSPDTIPVLPDSSCTYNMWSSPSFADHMFSGSTEDSLHQMEDNFNIWGINLPFDGKSRDSKPLYKR